MFKMLQPIVDYSIKSIHKTIYESTVRILEGSEVQLCAAGWPMFLFHNSRVGVCGAMARLTGAACCPPCRPTPHPAAWQDNCCACNITALTQVAVNTVLLG